MKFFNVFLLLAGPLVSAQRVTSTRASTIPVYQGASSSHIVSFSLKSSSSLATAIPRSSQSALSSSSPSSSPIPPQGSGGICGGSPNGCWGNLSILTDSETTWPNTSRIVEYNFTLTNTTCAPDGVTKSCLLVNNQFPGPTIEANWGDMVKININNQLQDNGTSFHWHGVRQKGSNHFDGVNGLTECPLAPGQTRTYMWQATSYGTSWYHSHSSTQYGDGVLGPIVIHGPTSAGYDIDMGPITISEIYRIAGGGTTVDAVIGAQGPLLDVADNTLFNGMNVNSQGGGKRLQMTFEPGMKHLMRFINTGVDNFYKVGLDGHMMQVVAIDLQPVQPYYAQYVSLGVGQRFDAIVMANNTVGNYWLRALPMSCVSNNNDGKGNQNAIISYKGALNALPTTTAAPVIDNCLDEPAEKTIPIPEKPVNISSFDVRHLPIASPFQVTTTTEGRVFRWSIGNTTQSVNWENPILQRLVQGNSTITPEDNLIGVDEPDTWAFWYIQNNFYEPHPIHMHGNDLRILATGDGQWDEDVSKLETANPTRRDTFMMRAGGYAILAFYTDNPGVWLLHCHIAWHVSEGLSTSLFVRKNDIKPNFAVGKNIEDGCSAWNQYLSMPNVTHYQRLGSGV